VDHKIIVKVVAIVKRKPPIPPPFTVEIVK
jgi:hypothetical protein